MHRLGIVQGGCTNPRPVSRRRARAKWGSTGPSAEALPALLEHELLVRCSAVTRILEELDPPSPGCPAEAIQSLEELSGPSSLRSAEVIQFLREVSGPSPGDSAEAIQRLEEPSDPEGPIGSTGARPVEELVAKPARASDGVSLFDSRWTPILGLVCFTSLLLCGLLFVFL